LKLSTTLAVIEAIVTEFTGSEKGLGYLIVVSSYLLETPRLFAAILLASLGGLLFFGLIALVEKKVIKWHY